MHSARPTDPEAYYLMALDWPHAGRPRNIVIAECDTAGEAVVREYLDKRPIMWVQKNGVTLAARSTPNGRWHRVNASGDEWADIQDAVA